MTKASTAGAWLTCFRRNPGAVLSLICFPHVGSGANIFRAWPDALPAAVEVCPVQLPGREKRVLEPPFNNLSLLVETIAPALLPYLDKPVAFFGHSMGAAICFELARHLRATHNFELVHLFVSGRQAPQLREEGRRTIYDLPEAEFLEELCRLNGTPPEVLRHPELMSFMLPMLRADFELIETYRYSAGPPLDCPITALGGAQDEDVSRESLQAWRERTTADFSLHMLPGDHFFLHSASSLLLKILSQELLRDLSRISLKTAPGR
ncbi:MAG TPA: thioesterase II family protein [Pyrinomonadaceae bacterium]|jgi:medium-chain acyl-[acyl-carrier-protein] hydrolase